jgi:beta-galactosidase
MDELSFKREHFAFDGILRLLSAANISFDAVNLLKPFSAEEVPTLWVFSTSCMDPDLQERLARYVQEGGKLVLYPEIPTRDLEGKPCRILADRLELGKWEVIPGNDVVDVLGIESVAVKQRLRFERYEGEPIALYTRQNRRETAAYHKQAGNGEILVLGIAMGQDFDYQLDVIRAVAERIGVRPHLSADVPHLSVVERRNGSESFLFVLNYTEWEQETNLYEGGRPLFDGEKIVLPPRSGAMYLRNFPVAEGLLIEYATVEMTHWESAEGRVDLTVRPVGRSGMLKIRMGGGWRANIETSPEKGLLRIGPIDKPVTLTFWRETDT